MRLLARVSALAALVALVGCSSDARAPVSGKVYIGDKPLTGGEVRFHGAKTFVATKIGPDGSYSITDAPVGECKVSVHPPSSLESKAGAPPKGTPTIEGADAPPPPKNPDPKLAEKEKAAPKTGMPGVPSGVIPIGPVSSNQTGIIKGSVISEKYQSESTTDLTFTVVKNANNTFDVKLPASK